MLKIKFMHQKNSIQIVKSVWMLDIRKKVDISG